MSRKGLELRIPQNILVLPWLILALAVAPNGSAETASPLLKQNPQAPAQILREGKTDPLLAAFRKKAIDHLYKESGVTPNVTNAIYLPDQRPLLCYVQKKGDQYVYGFAWSCDGSICNQEVSKASVARIGGNFGNFMNAGHEPKTSIQLERPLANQMTFISIKRDDFWHAWYELYSMDAGIFTNVWRISPWTSERGAFTVENHFAFMDIDNDGDDEIVNDHVSREAWHPDEKEEKRREIFKWDGSTFRQMK